VIKTDVDVLMTSDKLTSICWLFFPPELPVCVFKTLLTY